MISNADITLTCLQVNMQIQLCDNELTQGNIKCIIDIISLVFSHGRYYPGDLVPWVLTVNVVFPATRLQYFPRTASHILLGHFSLHNILRLCFTCQFQYSAPGHRDGQSESFSEILFKDIRIGVLSVSVVAKLLAPFSLCTPLPARWGEHWTCSRKEWGQHTERNMTEMLINFALLVLV